MIKIQKIIFLLFSVVILASCGGGNAEYKTPLDVLMRDLSSEKQYAIILHDMEIEDGFWSDKYKHQYKIIKEKEDGTPYEKLTEWKEVSEEFFTENSNNMGMELAAKSKDGKISKAVAPAGFGNYVGNNQYGTWRTGSNGTSFWEFYGQYAFMQSMFNLMTPVYRTDYYDYHKNYRYSSPYYGKPNSSGHYTYGTFGSNNATKNSQSPSFATKNSAFKNKINTMVTRSSSSPYNPSSSYSSKVSSSYGSPSYSSGSRSSDYSSSTRGTGYSSGSSSSFSGKVNSQVGRSSSSSSSSSSYSSGSSSRSRSSGGIRFGGGRRR